MSFDIFLQKFSDGQPVEVDRQPVSTVLQTFKFSGPDKFGYYIVDFPDGSTVEFSAKGLDGSTGFTSCAFHIHRMSPLLVSFILEIAKAGDLVILSAMEDFVPILSSQEQRQQLPLDLAQNDPEPVVCGSAAELESLLSRGYAGWQTYRDQITKRSA
jgi:hypothetical protein